MSSSQYHYINSSKVLLAFTDLVTFYLAFIGCAAIMKTYFPEHELVFNQYFYLRFFLIFSTLQICSLAVGLYNEKLRCSLKEISIRIIVAIALSYIITTTLYLFLPIPKDPLFVRESVYFLSLLALFATRCIFFLGDNKYISKRKVLVLGSGNRASLINSSMKRKSDRVHFDLFGYVHMQGDDVKVESTTPRIELPHESIPQFAMDNKIDEIVVGADERRGSQPTEQLIECKSIGIEIIDIIDFIERETGQIAVNHINPSWAIFNNQPITKSITQSFNWLFNLFLSLSILLATWPIILLTILAIKIEDGALSTIIYKQKRIGLKGMPFYIYKFRSMRTDAESNGAKMAVKKDPRVTKVGEFIRKFRIDELPQLFNVIRGDMCFVGPRPERPEFSDEFEVDIPFYKQRYYVKPGLTGWAQLKYPYGENASDTVEKLKFDLYYIKHRSFYLDLLILVRTSEIVLFGKGR